MRSSASLMAVAALIELMANLIMAAALDSTSRDEAGTSGHSVQSRTLSSPIAYLLLPENEEIFENTDLTALKDSLERVSIRRNANAETAFTQLKTANDNPEINESFILPFLYLSTNEANLDCEQVKSSVPTIMTTYGISKLYAYRTGNYENYLKRFGAQAYGYCARKINQELTETAKNGLLPGEQELNAIVAFASEPELQWSQCLDLDNEELFGRARQLFLNGQKIKAPRMLEAANRLKGVESMRPNDSSKAAKNLLALLSEHCEKIEQAFGLELGVLSMAYTFGGDDLHAFEPRLLKLLEYRRICITRKRYGWHERIEAMFGRMFERMFGSDKASTSSG